MTGDDILGRLDELIAPRPRAQRHGDRPAARRHPRQGAVAPTPTSAWRPIVEALRGGRRRGGHRPGHRHRAHAGPDVPRVRLAPGRLGQGGGGHRRRPHHRVRCAVLRRQSAQGLARGERPRRTRVSRSSRRRRTAASWSPSIRAPAASSRCARSPSSWSTRWAIRGATSRPTASPTSPPFSCGRRGGIGCA